MAVVAADGIISLLERGWSGVEIGVDSGCSSLRLIEHGCFMYLVDPYENYPEQFEPPASNEQRLRDLLAGHESQYEFFKMRSDEAQQYIPEVDFVFIDGNHHYEYVKKDIENYWPKVREGGWLTGHDYCNRCLVPKAVDEFVAANGLELKLLPLECWAVQKPKV